MTFASPLLLWALVLTAIPIAIHLFLRARPRPVVFPALRLLRDALAQGEQARRLRDRLVLALRVGAFASIAFALARPGCDASAGAGGAAGPTACALIVDDSVSMRYRPQFGASDTVLDAAVAQARAWVANTPQLKSPAFAVLTTSAPTTRRGLTSDPGEAAAQLAIAGAVQNARPLGAALGGAAARLGPVQDARRRIIVFTDGAASAWRDITPAALGGLEGCEIDVVACGPERPQDFRLVASAPDRQVAARTAAAVEVRVISTGAAALASVSARDLDAGSGPTVGPLALEADTAAEALLRLPPKPPGTHAAVLMLEPADLLDENQLQYVAWQSGATPVVRVMAADDLLDQDPTALLLANLLAPAGLPGDAQRVELVESVAPGGETSAAMLIVLPEIALDAAAAARIVAVIEQGATLLLVPAGAASSIDWPALRALLSEDAPRVELLDEPTAIAAPPGAAHDDPLRELATAGVRQRVRLTSLVSGATVVARYGDDVPAIIERRIGKGRAILLTTSPAPRWSDLGIRAGGLLTWLYARIDDAVGPPKGTLGLVAGESSVQRFETLPPESVVSVVRETDGGAAPVWVRLHEGRPSEPWPVDLPGIYAIRDGGVVRARYSVNWPDAEFELAPVTRAMLVERLGTERVRLVRSTAELAAVGSGGVGLGLSTVSLAALLALALLIFERWLSATRGRPER